MGAIGSLLIIILIFWIITEYLTYFIILGFIVFFLWAIFQQDVAKQQGNKPRPSPPKNIKPEPPPPKNIKELLYKQQKELCNGCKTHFPLRNLEIDHIVPKSKGGYHTASNLQLLCGYCNRVKGNRSQEYLLKRLRD